MQGPQQELNSFGQTEPTWDDLPGQDKRTLGMEERSLLSGSLKAARTKSYNADDYFPVFVLER